MIKAPGSRRKWAIIRCWTRFRSRCSPRTLTPHGGGNVWEQHDQWRRARERRFQNGREISKESGRAVTEPKISFRCCYQWPDGKHLTSEGVDIQLKDTAENEVQGVPAFMQEQLHESEQQKQAEPQEVDRALAASLQGVCGTGTESQTQQQGQGNAVPSPLTRTAWYPRMGESCKTMRKSPVAQIASPIPILLSNTPAQFRQHLLYGETASSFCSSAAASMDHPSGSAGRPRGRGQFIGHRRGISIQIRKWMSW